MGLFSTIGRWFKSMLSRFSQTDIETVLDIQIATSQEMRDAQDLWRAMDIGQAPWNDENVSSLMITNSLNRKIANLAALKSAHEVTGDSERAKFLNRQFQRVCDELQPITQKGNAGGMFVYKPAVGQDGEIYTAIVENNMYWPVNRNSRMELIEAIFFDFKEENDTYYTLVEHIIYNETSRTLDFIYRAFYNSSPGKLGKETSLNVVEEWANLQDIQFTDIDFPWFVEFRMPQVNIIDQSAPEGSALCANAVDNIRKADELEELTEHEFHAGRLKQNITSDMLRKDAYGNYIVDKDIFMVLEGTGIPGQELIQTYNPAFRHESLRSRLNDIKRNIEDNIGLSRGTISDVEQQAKTATEVEASRQDTASLVRSIQNNQGVALTQLVDIFDVMTDRYMLVSAGAWDLQLFWNDAVLVTEAEEQAKFDAELNIYIKLLSNNVITPQELRAFFNENSDSFSKLTPEMIQAALEGLPGAFDEGVE